MLICILIQIWAIIKLACHVGTAKGFYSQVLFALPIRSTLPPRSLSAGVEPTATPSSAQRPARSCRTTFAPAKAPRWSPSSGGTPRQLSGRPTKLGRPGIGWSDDFRLEIGATSKVLTRKVLLENPKTPLIIRPNLTTLSRGMFSMPCACGGLSGPLLAVSF